MMMQLTVMTKCGDRYGEEDMFNLYGTLVLHYILLLLAT